MFLRSGLLAMITALFFYVRATLSFSGIKALRHFLDGLSDVAAKCIVSINIKHRAYGHLNQKHDAY